jgi:predicted esterase
VNAIETLDDALRRYPIDPDRVVLTGHSMGGHGTWHVGLAHSDRFAALAPSAGWASFGSYVPFTLRRDVATAPPPLRAIWERAMAPDNPLSFLRNARGMPVFVLHGEKDDNVPVFQGRLLAQRAREEGVRVTYREVPGMGHWWDLPETPGVDCVDDPGMMALLKSARRAARPDSVYLCSGDLGTCDRSDWIVVDEALRAFERVEVEARIVRRPESGFVIRTSGVRALTCDPAGRFGSGTVRVAIDSDLLRAPAGEPVRLRLFGRRWRVVEGRASPRPGGAAASASSAPAVWGRRMPGRFRGSLKNAFFEPFVLVYGTRGTREMTEAMRRMAVLDAQNWYLRGDGYAPVLPDTAITPEIASTRNLILYALPGTNAVLESIASRLPIRLDARGVAIGRRRYGGRGLAARFVSANPRFPDCGIEVIAGTDLGGFELAVAANPCHSGSGYPDFMVFDAAVRWKGWGGMCAAGFFDADGRASEDGGDAYFRASSAARRGE